MTLEGDAGGSAMRPGRQKQATAQVELANADADFTLAPQQRLSVQRMRTRDQSATGTSAGTGGSILGTSIRPAT